MPRTRAELEREEKVSQILDRAVALLRDGGYEELTINRVAKDLGLARAAVYWYFPSRVDLFAAAAAKVFGDEFAGAPTRGATARRIQWGIDRLAGVYDIYLALQQLSGTEPAAAELLGNLHEMLCHSLRGMLADTVPAEAVEQVADSIMMFTDGLLARRLSPSERNRHLKFTLSALLSASPT